MSDKNAAIDSSGDLHRIAELEAENERLQRGYNSDIDKATTRIAELEAECFKLAAGSCIYDDGTGLVAHENGNAVCLKHKRIEELEAENERLRKAIQFAIGQLEHDEFRSVIEQGLEDALAEKDDG